MNNLSSCYRKEYKDKLKDFYSQYDFQWSCHLNISQRNVFDVNAIIKKWARTMSIKDHIQVAFVGVLNYLPQRHIHLLMLGRNAKGQSLLDKDKSEWESEWCSITHHNAVIKTKEDFGALGYVIDKNTPMAQHEWLTEYNIKLLKKSRR